MSLNSFENQALHMRVHGSPIAFSQGDARNDWSRRQEGPRCSGELCVEDYKRTVESHVEDLSAFQQRELSEGAPGETLAGLSS